MNKGDFFKQRSYTSTLLSLLWSAFFVSSVLYANTVTISLTILPPVTETGSHSWGGTTTGFNDTGSTTPPVNGNNGVITIPTGTVQAITTGVVQPIDQNTWVHNASTGDWDNNEDDGFLASPSTTIKDTTNPSIPDNVHHSADLTGEKTPIDSENNSCAPDEKTTPSNQISQSTISLLLRLSDWIFWWMDAEITHIPNIFKLITSSINYLTWSKTEEVLCATWSKSQSASVLTWLNEVFSGAFLSARIHIIDPILHFFAQLFHF